MDVCPRELSIDGDVAVDPTLFVCTKFLDYHSDFWVAHIFDMILRRVSRRVTQVAERIVSMKSDLKLFSPC